jgi:hypothetical protein
MSALLHPFPADLFPAINLRAEAALATDGLALSFFLTGNCAALVLPPPKAPEATGERRSQLWQSTCWECFAARENSPEYFEINLSPSHHWNVYHFTGYRQGMGAPPLPPPVIRSWRGNGWYRLDAVITGLPVADANWRLGLSAVLETTDGAKEYFALVHPSEKPDFHHRDGFIFSLKP